jgi:hypothetical protein
MDSEVQQCIREIYTSTRLLHSSSERAKCVEAVRTKDDILAAYVLGHFLQLNAQAATAKWVRGGFLAALFDQGLLEFNLESHRAAMGALFQETQRDAAASKQELRSLHQQYKEIVSQIDNTAGEQRTTFEELLKKSGDELANVAKTYDEHMALKAPVTYWEAVRRKHWWGKIIYGLSALFVGAAGMALILYLLWQVFPTDLPASPKEAFGNWHLIRFTSTGFVLLTGTIWLTRILVRMYLSHVHLEADAEERVVLTQTYLALLREEKAFTETERTVILQQLFRHAATGLIKDDSAPPQFFEILARAGEVAKDKH